MRGLNKPHFTPDRMSAADTHHAQSHPPVNDSEEMRGSALQLLAECDAQIKADATMSLKDRWDAGAIHLDRMAVLRSDAFIPGRPSRPALVSPRALERRPMNTVTGRAALIHALAHIEFNAINLALDAVWRFNDMPAEFYADWLQVAAEEALHFTLLNTHLASLGYFYGDFSAHNSLWEMAEKTREDVLARMALVPRTLEARGLDATPAVRAKLAQAGDEPAAAILDIILRDEVGHVAIGNRWYGWLCQKQGAEPLSTYRELARHYNAPVLKGPFNLEARRAAGFTEEELLALNKD
ncbi:MAG: hypothetical protein RI928_906 [Pseudomonadota bacterium]